MKLLHNIHYAWIIVLTGTMTIVAVLGLGRFSLGMLLPAMDVDLGLGYSRMGFIGTGNFIGYLLGVLVSSRLVKQFGFRVVISSGIFLVGGSMILVGTAHSFELVLLTFFCTGIGSGLGNVPAMGLVSQWFGSSLRGRAAGLMVSGSGLGIMLTGLLIPAVNGWSAPGQGWRVSWIIMGIIVLAISLFCSLLIRNRPQDKGLKIAERATGQKTGNKSPISFAGTTAPARKWLLFHLGGIYFFFGFTYVIYVTFVITTLITEYHFSEAIAGRFWFWFGLLGIFSGPIFGSLSDRIGRARTLALVYSLQGLAHLLLALNPLPGSAILSVAIFALSAWSVPSIIAAAVGDYFGPLKAATGFAAVTLFFSIGQISGPALAGIIAEQSGSFSRAYLLAVIVVLTGGLLCLFLPGTENEHRK